MAMPDANVCQATWAQHAIPKIRAHLIRANLASALTKATVLCVNVRQNIADSGVKTKIPAIQIRALTANA